MTIIYLWTFLGSIHVNAYQNSLSNSPLRAKKTHFQAQNTNAEADLYVLLFFFILMEVLRCHNRTICLEENKQLTANTSLIWLTLSVILK